MNIHPYMLELLSAAKQRDMREAAHRAALKKQSAAARRPLRNPRLRIIDLIWFAKRTATT